jgi:hypothetical protein
MPLSVWLLPEAQITSESRLKAQSSFLVSIANLSALSVLPHDPVPGLPSVNNLVDTLASDEQHRFIPHITLLTGLHPTREKFDVVVAVVAAAAVIVVVVVVVVAVPAAVVVVVVVVVSVVFIEDHAPREHNAILHHLSETLKTFQLHITGVATGSTFHQCLFFTVEKTEEVVVYLHLPFILIFL